MKNQKCCKQMHTKATCLNLTVLQPLSLKIQPGYNAWKTKNAANKCIPKPHVWTVLHPLLLKIQPGYNPWKTKNAANKCTPNHRLTLLLQQVYIIPEKCKSFCSLWGAGLGVYRPMDFNSRDIWHRTHWPQNAIMIASLHREPWNKKQSTSIQNTTFLLVKLWCVQIALKLQKNMNSVDWSVPTIEQYLVRE